MSNTVSALVGETFAGIVSVEDAGLTGMITLRGDLSDGGLRDAVTGLTGTAFPDARRAETAGDTAVCWMSPDELLIVMPYENVGDALKRLGETLGGTHHLAVDVSDARAVIRLSGKGAALRETLAKLTPADMRVSALPAGEMRRTRLAQVPAAFWFEDEGTAHVICFRSVARYVFGILKQSAELGSEVGYFR